MERGVRINPIWTSIGLSNLRSLNKFVYSSEKKYIALKVFHQTNSVSETIRILGYPTRRQLYSWINDENLPSKERIPLPRMQILQSTRIIRH